jgi:succinate dehydrogenase / fumarate reductase cytochrome b subunit
MHTQRPVNLALTKFRFPLAAIASITHRITGMLLFLGIALFLYLIDLALSSQVGFADAKAFIAMPLPKLVLLAVLATLTYHVVAGVKHLIMDFHIGDTLEGGARGAQLSIVITLVLVALAGAWLW